LLLVGGSAGCAGNCPEKICVEVVRESGVARWDLRESKIERNNGAGTNGHSSSEEREMRANELIWVGGLRWRWRLGIGRLENWRGGRDAGAGRIRGAGREFVRCVTWR